jgi:hypothetical protein
LKQDFAGFGIAGCRGLVRAGQADGCRETTEGIATRFKGIQNLIDRRIRCYRNESIRARDAANCTEDKNCCDFHVAGHFIFFNGRSEALYGTKILLAVSCRLVFGKAGGIGAPYLTVSAPKCLI